MRFTPRTTRRILTGVTIVYICFLSLFALDAFAGDAPVWEKVIGFLFHMLPSFLLILLLVVARRHPGIGSTLFLLVALGTLLFFKTYQQRQSLATITGPLVLLAVGYWSLAKQK